MAGYLGTVWVALGVLLISKIWNLFNILVWRPYAIRKWFAKQGISGPPCSFISGSLYEMKTLKMQASNTVLDTHSHDIIPRILPHHHKWASQYLPTRWNLDTWKLERKLRNRLKSIIEERLNSKDRNGSNSGYGEDLLGIMLGISESSKKQEDLKLSMDEIMDECKTFFFAGHETTANLLTWTIYLLSLYKEWQERLREEVMKECGMDIPDTDNLNKLKLDHERSHYGTCWRTQIASDSVNRFLLEALRLYCPAIELYRTTTKDTKLGDLMIPKNTTVAIPMVMIHRNKKYWGEDADEFNPLRFADGVSRAASHPNAFLAFSTGSRACIGQNFTMLEAKTVVTMILQRFSLSLSPEYNHAPMNELTLQPQFGLPILLSMAH